MKYYLRTLKYLWPYKRIVLLTWSISLLVLFLQGLSVWIGADFIENLLMGGSDGITDFKMGTLAGFMEKVAVYILHQSTPFKSLIAAVIVLLGSAMLTTFFRVIKTYLFARMNQSILIRLRSELFVHMTRMDLAFSRSSRPGEIASLFMQDAEQLKSAIIDAVDRVFMQPIRLVMAFSLMLSLSVELTLWTFSFLIASSLTVHLAGGRIENLTKKVMEKVAHLQGLLTEYLSAVIVARSLGREDYEKKRFSDACTSLAQSTINLNVLRSLVPQLINNLFVLSGGILLLFGGYKVLVSHTLSGSALLKMAFLLPVATYPIEALSSLYLSMRSSIASAKRVFQFMDKEESYDKDYKNAIEPKELKEKIEFKDVSYTISGHSILSHVSLTFKRGKRTVIYGPSGAGKTTILSLLAGLAIPSGGSILVDDLNMNQIKQDKWRRQIGIVIQEPILFNASVRDNLKYACPDSNDEKLKKVLKNALLWNDDGCVFPDGLDYKVGNRGELISGGERQRLTIARAILNSPDILLMDEPAAMLDVDSKEKIRDTILSVSMKRTLILVTHDPFLRSIADFEYQIKAGRVI